MDLDRLLRSEKPWLHLLVMAESEACDLLWDLPRSATERVVSRVIRGRKAMTKAALFDEFAAALQFPCGFGENWDAFDECLADLEWLPADAYAILITSAARLLEKEPAELPVLLQILDGAAQAWSRPVEGQWPRPPRAFHVILQCAPELEKTLRAQLDAAKASYNVLS
jgi:hypothetical protein